MISPWGRIDTAGIPVTRFERCLWAAGYTLFILLWSLLPFPSWNDVRAIRQVWMRARGR